MRQSDDHWGLVWFRDGVCSVSGRALERGISSRPRAWVECGRKTELAQCCAGRWWHWETC